MVIRIISVCGVLLFAVPLTHAAEVTPTGIQTTYKTAAGTFAADVILKHTSQTYGTKYSLQPTNISMSSFGKMIKSAVRRGPLLFAITTSAAILKDIYWDETEDDFVRDGDGASLCPGGGTDCYPESGAWCYTYPYGSAQSCFANYPSAETTLRPLIESDSLNFVCEAYVASTTRVSLRYSRTFSGNQCPTWHYSVPIDYFSTKTPNQPDAAPEKEVVPDINLGEDFFKHWFDGEGPSGASSPKGRWPYLPHAIIDDDVKSGDFDPPQNDWPELSGERDGYKEKLDDRDDPTFDPGTDPEPFTPQEEHGMSDPEDKPSSTTNITNNTYNQTSEGLVGCDLLPVVCDIWNWLSKDEEPPILDPEPEIQTELITIEDIPQVDNQLGAGTCPEPIDLTIFGEVYAISYDPFCGFAEKLRPIILASAWMAALFIVTRSRG